MKRERIRSSGQITAHVKRALVAWSLLFALVSSVAQAGDEDEKIDPTKFEEMFKSLVMKQPDMPSAARHRALNMHYVFVTGFGGGLVPGYFHAQTDELRRLGVPMKNIHVLSPPSRVAVRDNGEWLKNEIAKIPGRIVIVGHSKGAAESLVFAAQNPEVVKDRVEGMYLLQGAFQGSIVADILMNKRERSGQPFTFWERMMISLNILRGKMTYGLLYPKGLKSLGTDTAVALWKELGEKHPDSAKAIAHRVHFITSVAAKENDPVVREIHHHVGPNDDILHLPSQSVEGWGSVIGMLSAGHLDLVLPSFTKDGSARRRSLIRTIFAAVESRTTGGTGTWCPWVQIGK